MKYSGNRINELLNYMACYLREIAIFKFVSKLDSTFAEYW